MAPDDSSRILDLAHRRIDQHLKFFDSLENIRWKFTTGFGVGTVGALFLAMVSESSSRKLFVAHAVVWALSVAAVVTQIRIYALVVVIWRRILVIQELEGRIVHTLAPGEADFSDALLFPRVGVFRSRWLQLLTVGMVSCFVFAALLGISATLLAHHFSLGRFSSAAVGILVTILVSLVSVAGSNRYITAVEASDSEPVNVGLTRSAIPRFQLFTKLR